MGSLSMILFLLVAAKSQNICTEWLDPYISSSLSPTTTRTTSTDTTEQTTPTLSSKTTTTTMLETSSSTATRTTATDPTEQTTSTSSSETTTTTMLETSPSTATRTTATDTTEQTSTPSTTSSTTTLPFVPECEQVAFVPKSEFQTFSSNIDREQFFFLNEMRKQERLEHNVALCMGATISLLGMALLGADGKTNTEIASLPLFRGINKPDHMLPEILHQFYKYFKFTYAAHFHNGVILDHSLEQVLRSNYVKNINHCFKAITRNYDLKKGIDVKDSDIRQFPVYDPFLHGAPLPSKETGLVLVSTVTFSATLGPESTMKNKKISASFTLSNGLSEQTYFIQILSDEFYYYENKKAIVAGATCYKNGYSPKHGKFLFIAMLPKKQKMLDPRKINSLMKAYKELVTYENFQEKNQQLVQITVPEFTIGYNNESLPYHVNDLKPILKSLGMKKAFSSKDAELSKITEPVAGPMPLYVADMFHVTRFILNGTKEFGYGGAIAPMEPMDVPPKLKKRDSFKKFRADRPFLFFIVAEFMIENFHHLVPLFSGVVMNPN